MPNNFAHQDLRNRSFKGCHLSGADFQGSDIRGCNFRNAKLVDANFAGAKAGQTGRQRLMALVLAIIVLLVVGDAVFRLIFGAIGQTPEDKAWGFVLLLYGVLSLAGASAGVAAIALSKSRARKLADPVTVCLTGALWGFFQAGSATDNNPMAAIAGAVLGGACFLGVSLGWRGGWIAVAIAAMGSLVAYGAAFLLGTLAIGGLNVQLWGWGMLLTLLTLGYLGLTWQCLLRLIQAIQKAGGTSFRGADLTGAQFDGADLRQTDFDQTIGEVDL